VVVAMLLVVEVAIQHVGQVEQVAEEKCQAVVQQAEMMLAAKVAKVIITIVEERIVLRVVWETHVD
jgi:hypothetical protein